MLLVPTALTKEDIASLALAPGLTGSNAFWTIFWALFGSYSVPN